MPELDQLIQALSNPKLYPNRPESVEVRQTHASVAFLAGDEVYKLKKPVDYGFLDYSTLDRRREMCHLEVKRNRRLAPDVYRDIVPVTSAEGKRVEIDGEGEVIDYLVRMRRLPDGQSLKSRILDGSIGQDEIKMVARTIAEFHRNTNRGKEIDSFGSIEHVAENVNENFEQTAEYVGGTITPRAYAGIIGYSRDFLARNRHLFQQRVDAGHIVDGHGDLRAEHVYLGRGIEIIDCIEFNDRFRYGDVTADLAFLAMDIDSLGTPDLADALVSEYQSAYGNDLSLVLDFYRCYRAYVRGKVASLRVGGQDAPEEEAAAARREAKRYFQLALRHARGERRPLLLLTSGVTGAGKSTLAQPLAEILAARYIQSDVVRKQLAGLDPTTRQHAEPGGGLYSREMSKRVYATVLERAEEQLALGRSVVLDATYQKAAHRDRPHELARRYNARFLAVECIASEQVIRQRLERRESDPQSVSDGHLEVYLKQRDAYEPMLELGPGEKVAVNTALEIEKQIDTVLSWL